MYIERQKIGVLPAHVAMEGSSVLPNKNNPARGYFCFKSFLIFVTAL